MIVGIVLFFWGAFQIHPGLAWLLLGAAFFAISGGMQAMEEDEEEREQRLRDTYGG